MIRKIWGDLKQYRLSYLLRASLAQLLVTGLGTYFLSELLAAIIGATGQTNLGKDSLYLLLTKPLSLVLTGLYLLCLAFLMVLEASLLVTILRLKDSPLRVERSLIWRELTGFWRSLSGGDFLAFLVYLLITLPFVHLFLASSLVEDFYLPHFILDELMKAPLTAGLVTGLGLLGFYLNVRLMYSLPLVAVTKSGLWTSMKASWHKTKKGNLRRLWDLTRLQVLVFIWHSFWVTLLVLTASFLDPDNSNRLIKALFLSLAWGILFSGFLLTKLGTMLYLLHSLGEQVFIQPRFHKSKTRQRFLILLLFLTMGGTQFWWHADLLTGQAYNPDIKIIAHRGLVSQGVENSIEALEAAAAAGVDYVEMDIILTKDGQFVVSHDNNLKRLTGQDISISESQAAEVIGLPIQQEDFSSQLVSFETYVARAKELGVKLLVELKPHGQEPDNYPDLFVQEMSELGVLETYPAMSLDLDLMRQLEKKAPSLKTGQIIPLQLGDFGQEPVDFFVLEDFSYRDRLAWQAKQAKKDLYVWTINRSEQLQAYLQSQVSGIITDNPDWVPELKADLEANNSYWDRFARLYE